MRAVKIRFVNNRVLKLARAAGWLNGENIQTGANTATSSLPGQRCLLIHDFASRSVDEVTALPHRIEKIGADEIFGFRIQARDEH